MLRLLQINSLRDRVRSSSFAVVAAVMALSGLLPVVLQGSASAAQLTSRKVTISTSQADATGVTYSFAFTTATASTIQSMVFQFCDQPLGTCVLPGTDGSPLAAEKLDVAYQTAAPGAFTGTTGTAFSEQTTATGGCTDNATGSGTATMYCVTRTEATSEGVGAKTFAVTGISNPIIPSGNNEEIYVRVTTYSDTAFVTAVDTGTVAASIVNQLTVTGRVQERLVFCVYALTDVAGSAVPGAGAGAMPENCSATEANSGTEVDLGVVDNTTIARSPVNNSATNPANDKFGAAQINTNAAGGVALTFFATAATSGTEQLAAFRVPGATCNASAAFIGDQCFVSADNTNTAGNDFAAGTERFGMHVACIANAATAGSGLGTTSNLGSGGTGTGASGGTYNTVYSDTDDTVTDNGSDDCENDAGSQFGWNVSGTATPLVHSSSVVDDEIVKLRFGATADATTPTGTYTVATTFIATPTF